MRNTTALVVERDPALRRLMRSAVQQAGYSVIECSNPLQLKVELRALSVVEAESAFLVLSTDIARQCSDELVTLVRDRARAGKPSLEVAFTCEFGAPARPPAFGAYALLGILEKPFSLDDLEQLARLSQRRRSPE